MAAASAATAYEERVARLASLASLRSASELAARVYDRPRWALLGTGASWDNR